MNHTQPTVRRPHLFFDDNEFFGVAENELGKNNFFNRNKEVFTAVGNKVLDKVLSKFDDEEFYAENELGKNDFFKRNKEVLTMVGDKILDKILSKFDDGEINEDELNFLKGVGNFFKKNGPTIGKIGLKVLPMLLEDQESNDELFNLGGLIKDGLNIYSDIRNKDYGSIVDHGKSVIHDIKKKH